MPDRLFPIQPVSTLISGGQPLNEIYCGPAPVPSNLLASWNFDLVAILLIAGLAIFCIRANASRANIGAACGLLFVLFISPLCALTSALFSARAVHHLVLVAAVAPLLAATVPRLRSKPALSLAGAAFLHAVTFWIWHFPPLYDAALRNDVLYWLMQFTLLGSAVVLWQGILARDNLAHSLAALFATATQMGMLGALLTFAPRPLYLLHTTTTGPFGLSPVEDQQLAGLIMWVPGVVPYLGVAAWLAWSRLDSRPGWTRP